MFSVYFPLKVGDARALFMIKSNQFSNSTRATHMGIDLNRYRSDTIIMIPIGEKYAESMVWRQKECDL